QLAVQEASLIGKDDGEDAAKDAGQSASKGYFRATSVAFWAVHVAAIAGVAYLGFSWRGVALAIGVYFARMIVVTAGYHRYFAHRSFKTSRPVQFLLAL